MSYSKPSKKSRSRGCSFPTLVLIAAPFLAMLLCCVGFYFVTELDSDVAVPSKPGQPEPGTLRVAYSSEKADLFNRLVTGFNSEAFKTSEGDQMRIEAVEMEPEAMIQAAMTGELQAVNPDSSIWLDQIDRAWMSNSQTATGLVGSTARYAISPVVIAMWDDVAHSMGHPDRRLGWDDIIAKATTDPDFKWSHPSTGSASGLLATLAMFYAGADKTRGLTVEDAIAESTLDYVSAVQKTVRQYGEGERAVIQQIVEQGPDYLDAFVVSEQLVIFYNTGSHPGNLVAVYPREGTLWEDHPLALLETPALRADQRAVFQKFREYLVSQASQQEVLTQGFRPTDLSIPLTGALSPVTMVNGVDPAEPQTALQIPSASVVEVVRDVWWYTKRKTNVFLVADTSGSMMGEKLEAAREAMTAFVEQIKGDGERVGLVTFSSQVNNIIPLGSLSSNRVALNNEIQNMEAGGDTALLDAVWAAYARLQDLNDGERINAIVAMTDGRENNSRVWLDDLVAAIEKGNEMGIPVVIFSVAYGDDADYGTLGALADASNGQVRQGDPTTIRDLYKLLSTYF
jgi:Ca-activated chloride channel family protein